MTPMKLAKAPAPNANDHQFDECAPALAGARHERALGQKKLDGAAGFPRGRQAGNKHGQAQADGERRQKPGKTQPPALDADQKDRGPADKMTADQQGPRNAFRGLPDAEHDRCRQSRQGRFGGLPVHGVIPYSGR